MRGLLPQTEPRPGHPFLAGAPLLIAHRGGAALAPENTLPAFDRALRWWRTDILELDVQPTRDGEAVAIHDSALGRTTDGSGPVAEHTAAELRELDAGFHFTPDSGATYPFRGRGVGVPTLREVLAEFPGARLNVEIKDPAASAAVFAAVADSHAQRRVLVAAGHRGAGGRFARYPGATSASASQLRRFYVASRLRLARWWRPHTDALQIPLRYGGREVATPTLVGDAHRHNLAVHVWTVDDADEMRRLLERGVDGVVTDRPDRLAGVIHELTGRPLPPGPPPDEAEPAVARLLTAG